MSRGVFYIESDGCLACCIPEREAPTLIGFREDPTGTNARGHCYFKKQPETAEEVEQAFKRSAPPASIRFATPERTRRCSGG